MKTVLNFSLAFSLCLLPPFAAAAQAAPVRKTAKKPLAKMIERKTTKTSTAQSLPPKASVAIVSKIRKVPKPVAEKPAANPLETVTLGFYPANGSIRLGDLSGLVVSPNLVAAKIENINMFQAFSRRLRILLSGSRFVNLKIVSLNLETGWILLSTDQVLSAPREIPLTIPHYFAPKFGYADGYKMAKDWENLLMRIPHDRQVASRVSPGALIETELSRVEEKNINSFISTTKKVEIERFALFPFADNLICEPSSVKVDEVSTHLLISGATAIKCRTQISEGLLGMRLEGGVVDFWANRSFSNKSQSQMLSEIASFYFNNHNSESKKVEDSTHALCEKSFITENDIEVHYCTRTLRSSPSFQDTVAIFGKRSKQRFLYTLVSTGALSEAGTKSVFEAIFNVLETNP